MTCPLTFTFWSLILLILLIIGVDGYVKQNSVVKSVFNRDAKKIFLPLIISQSCINRMKIINKLSEHKRISNTKQSITAICRSALKRMPVLRNLVETPEEFKTLLCLVNPKSGGKQGELVMNRLLGIFHAEQVVDLTKCNPKDAIEKFSTAVPRYRILVCGGDGTIGWVLNSIQNVYMKRPTTNYSSADEANEITVDSSNVWMPPVAVLPIGTGNDLSKSLGWGDCFDNGSLSSSLPSMLEKIVHAEEVPIDRWQVKIIPQEGLLPRLPIRQGKHIYSSVVQKIKDNILYIRKINKKKLIRSVNFQNYFGIGVDAKIVYDFDALRKSSPGLFMHRTVNKMFYGIMGFMENCSWCYRLLRSSLWLPARSLWQRTTRYFHLTNSINSANNNNYSSEEDEDKNMDNSTINNNATDNNIDNNILNGSIEVMNCSSSNGGSSSIVTTTTSALDIAEEYIPFSEQLQLVVDGRIVSIPSDAEGIVFLNIDSYGGGSRLWKDDEDNSKIQELDVSCSDGDYDNSDSYSGTSDEGIDDNSKEKDSVDVGEEEGGHETAADNIQNININRKLDINDSDNDDRRGVLVTTVKELPLNNKVAISSRQQQNCLPPSRCYQQASMADGLLEVVAIRSAFELAQVKLNRAKVQKLAQGRHIEVTSTAVTSASVAADIMMAMQADGEPWKQSLPFKLVFDVVPKQFTMLQPPAATAVCSAKTDLPTEGENNNINNNSRGD